MKALTSLVCLCLGGTAAAEAPDTFAICLQDDSGERIRLDVHPSGLLLGHSEIGIGPATQVTGTAFGSYKRLAYPNVMLGGDINNDCASGLGLLPGKFNATVDVRALTGSATGVLFVCDPSAPGGVVPFTTAIVPCREGPVPAANWRKFFVRGDPSDDDDRE